MPRGVKKETTATSEPNAQANGKPASKMEGVQRALAELGNEAKPLKIQDWLKTTFKIKMPISTISNYKSTILSGAGKKGPPAKRKGGQPKVRAGGITIHDIEAVKALVDRMGAEKVQQLAQVLAK
jgi:hypothetical protein